jgi:peptide/nickel transport system permease protein
VLRIIGEQLGATAELAAAALGAAVAFGIGLGVLAAQDRSHVLASTASGLATLALSAPVYWTGTLAITVFAVWLGWLPATSGEGVRFLVLPAGVLGFSLSGSIARVTRANIRETKSQNFVMVAAGKGLRGREIWGRHILRAALPPVLSVIGLQLGFLLGGTVITEALFARRGIGGLLVDAILNQDFPVVQGIVVMSAAVYAGAGALTDILHALADPRLREMPEPEAN